MESSTRKIKLSDSPTEVKSLASKYELTTELWVTTCKQGRTTGSIFSSGFGATYAN